MKWFFDNERPIYVQLVEQLEIMILSGDYQLGEKLPSVRELADLAKVNPNTMQKAFLELEEKGLVYTKRTSGRYVTSDKKIIDRLKLQQAKEITDNYIRLMIRLGFSNGEVISYLEKKGR